MTSIRTSVVGRDAHSRTIRVSVVLPVVSIVVVMMWVRLFAGAPNAREVLIVADPEQINSYCGPLLAKVPSVLAGREVQVRAPSIRVWGSGAVTLACGVARPAELKPDSSAQVLRINDVDFMTKVSGRFVDYVSIDRELYVLVRVSRALDGGPLPQLAALIGASMERVCETQGYGEVYPTARLCSRRR